MRKIICLILCCLLYPSISFSGIKQIPVIKALKVTPLPFDAWTGLTVEPVLIEAGEEYEFKYRWFLNGEEVFSEAGESFPGSLLKRGDEVAVEVTPLKADIEGLMPLFGLPLKAVNASPKISSTPPVTFANNSFTYQVSATDPDGDPLVYRLENAPEGMKIDPDRGEINWVFEDMPVGRFSVTIIVEDGFDGRAEQQIELDMSYVDKEK